MSATPEPLPTPRTDACFGSLLNDVEWIDDSGKVHRTSEVVDAKDARELERELAALRALSSDDGELVKRLREAHDLLSRGHYADTPALDAIDEAATALSGRSGKEK